MMDEFRQYRPPPPKFLDVFKERCRAARRAFQNPERMVDEHYCKAVTMWDTRNDFSIIYSLYPGCPPSILEIPPRLKSQIRVALNQMNRGKGASQTQD